MVVPCLKVDLVAELGLLEALLQDVLRKRRWERH